MGNGISQEMFTTIVNEENIKMMKSERGDIERDKVIKDGKKWQFLKLLSKMKELITIYKKHIKKLFGYI